MHLVQAVISGRESDRSRAHQHLAEAKRIGEQLGSDPNDFETEFGHTNVQLHAVAVAIDPLGDAGEALDVARGIDASGLSPERQARLLVDVARAQGQRRHTGEATKALLGAECLAAEHVWSHHLTHSTIRYLIGQLGIKHRPTWSNSHVEAEQCRSAGSPVGGDVLGEPSLITVAAATPRPHVSHDDPGSRLGSPVQIFDRTVEFIDGEFPLGLGVFVLGADAVITDPEGGRVGSSAIDAGW